jgi:hypothetical protein
MIASSVATINRPRGQRFAGLHEYPFEPAPIDHPSVRLRDREPRAIDERAATATAVDACRCRSD